MTDAPRRFYGTSAGVARPSQPWAERFHPVGMAEGGHLSKEADRIGHAYPRAGASPQARVGVAINALAVNLTLCGTSIQWRRIGRVSSTRPPFRSGPKSCATNYTLPESLSASFS